ncbi:MAG TPA: hypothetical protein VK541_04000 [Pedobacter sp.]|uniref:hypothetical protein n=1 Tax=Pedobacter sp. TaxID=1411316 RepID=UPI002B92B19A|nr:hypothetical protein [Pedobacter sp.]HMI01617.1 hypothetical protein [Pedobacter sp.]
MSSIKNKIGQCIDCNGGVNKPIVAKRCISAPEYHYQKYNSKRHQDASVKNKKAKAARAESYSKEGYTIGKWFNDQIAVMPYGCENCGDKLIRNAVWGSKAYVAHIVPKRFFESVMLHPLNRVFLCIDCHTKFDNSLSREVEAMPVYPLAVERFNLFKHMIVQIEIKHLSPCFDIVYIDNVSISEA